MLESVLETLPVTEQSLYFPCGDGEMISVLGKCDGKRDCISGLDEEGCSTSGKFPYFMSVSSRICLFLGKG